MVADPRWWRPAVFVVVVIGVALRVGFALAIAPDLEMPGDAKLYREMAAHLADGDGLSLPGIDTAAIEPSAEHPPAFPLLLAGLDLIGLGAVGAQRVALGVLSGSGVALVAILGRRIGGPAVGVVAAAIAAVHPLWFQSAGMVMSESLHMIFIPVVLVAALALLDQPGRGRAALLGAAIGVAALNRPESLGFAVVVALPAVALVRRPWGERFRIGLVVGLACLAVVTPWLVRNEVQLGSATLATNSGKTLQGSNCAATYAGPGRGGFDYDCQFGAAAYLVDVGPPGGGRWDALALDRALGDAGEQFIRDHRGEVPKVVVARVARMWGVAFAEDQLRFDVGEGRDRSLQRAGQWVHLALLPLGVAGAALLVRRGRVREALLLAGGPVLVTSTTLLIYGGTRMRSGAEPAIALFAAIALVEAARAARTTRRRFADPDAPGSNLHST